MLNRWYPRVSIRSDSSQTNAFAIGAAAAVMEPLEARTFFSATPAPTATELVAQANNAFAFDLLHQLAPDSSGNTFFSPYSAATALEMALQGAKGVTASEMIQTLHLPSADLAQAGIQALYQLFEAAPADAGYTLSTANRLWVNANYPVLESFITNSQNTFGAGPQTVDFSDPTAAANTINAWVSGQTNGKITNLIPADDLNQYTALVITNAIYFKGNWAAAFDPNLTKDAPFQISSTEASTVSMMQQTHDFSYYAQAGANGFQAVDLPYGSGNLDMLVILPTSYDLTGFESTLTSNSFAQITSNLSPADVNVSFPKFQLGETYDLIPPLQNLGMKAAFTAGADFTGIFAEPQPFQISTIVQKSFISVDETGSEAAAATGIVVTALAATFPPPSPISFNANHPFLFAIRDNATNTILFLGSVADPSNGAADYVTPAPAISNPTFPTNPTPPGEVIINPIIVSAPDKTAVAGLTISAVAGESFTATLGTIELPAIPTGATRSVIIHWGDGHHSTGTLTPNGAAFSITGGHLYHAHRKFHVTIAVQQKFHGKLKILAHLKATAIVVASNDSQDN